MIHDAPFGVPRWKGGPVLRGIAVPPRPMEIGQLATAKDVSARLNTHEAVCAERWKETIVRIKRLELVMITSAGAVILLMATLLWKI